MAGGKSRKGEVFIVDGRLAERRLDAVLVALIPEISRTLWQRALADGQVYLDNKLAKPSQKVAFGSRIEILERPAHLEPALVASEVPEIIYQDDDVIVVNKPAGIIAHPKPGKEEPSLAGTFAHLVDDDRLMRPGIIHRLDKDTSGVMILARNQKARAHLEGAFRARRVDKIYWALVWGEFGRGVKRLQFGLTPAGKSVGVMRVDPLGKPAETIVSQLQFGDGVALVEARPRTGRTHQIRVHLSAIKHPILGDVTYGRQDGVARQMLHARSLGLVLPNGERQIFTASLPSDFQATMNKYGCHYDAE
ncbi:RluA family pseudouridine synthase [bacterium]|nr:MAG: RluA family pseudouridine synthase [bacterium]